MTTRSPARKTRANLVVAAFVASATLAACGDQDPVVGPLLPPEPPANPQIVQASWLADVNRVTGKVSITAPVRSFNPQILADYFGLEPGHPELSILAGDVVEVLAQNPVFSNVGAFLPGLVRTTFEIAVRNRLNVINLIAPTFPDPPVGTTGPLVVPFEVVVTTTSGGVIGGQGDGTGVIVELPNRGTIAVSTDFDGAPHNFFNDTACGPTDNDCYRYEEFSTIAGGATSAYSVVGFDHEPTVNQFRARMIVAADIENASPNILPVAAISGPATGAIGAAVPFSGAGSSDADGTIVNYEWFVNTVSAQSGASATFNYTCVLPAGPRTIGLTVTDDRSGTHSTSVTLDCQATPALGNATKTAAVGATSVPDGGTVAPGSTVVYTLSATNVGTGGATGVTMTDVVPAGLTYVSSSAGCVQAAGTVTCTQGALASAATATFTITVTASGASGTAVTNTSNWTSTNAGSATADHDLTIQAGANLLGRWVSSAGAPITSASVGQTVRFQLCTTVSDMNAYQSNIEGFAARATNTASGDLVSSGSGVHPDCVGTTDNLNAFFTASGTVDPVNAQIVSTSAPGVGIQGIFDFTFSLTSAGTLTIAIPAASIVANNVAGPVTIVQNIQTLTVNP